ncbi:hypothetical protein, partial [Acinetobacter sp.]|uniref:hypothetical protein n=1 Tax=Acinetobacter sp. TaxID=472 RepID=UPI002FCB2E83
SSRLLIYWSRVRVADDPPLSSGFFLPHRKRNDSRKLHLKIRRTAASDPLSKTVSAFFMPGLQLHFKTRFAGRTAAGIHGPNPPSYFECAFRIS